MLLSHPLREAKTGHISKEVSVVISRVYPLQTMPASKISLCTTGIASPRALRYLVGMDSLISALSSLSQDHTLTPLLSTLLTSLLDAHMTQLHGDEDGVGGAPQPLLLELLDEVHLEDATTYALIR